VDRRDRASRPAEHQQLHGVVLVHEVSRVASRGELDETIEGGGLDPSDGQEVTHLDSIECAAATLLHFAHEVGHGHEQGRRHRAILS
jgi:hypothetical protein